MDSLKLEPTAALVMLWALPLYREGPARRFVEGLDLSSGERLLGLLNPVCDWYGEVILNRKHFIRGLTKALLEDGCSQLVILGAGRSPLAMELVLERPETSAFEVDVSGMDEKRDLYAEVCPEALDRLCCLTADITSEDLMDVLEGAGYRRDLPSVVLLEGISYYLEEDGLKGIVSGFRSGGRNAIVIEYLRPCREVEPSRRQIPKEVFSLIGREAKGRIKTYSEEELRGLLEEAKGRLESCHTMAEMERARCKENRYFPDRESGWIECVVGRL